MKNNLETHHLNWLSYYGLLNQRENCAVRHFKAGEEIFSQGVEYKFIMIVVAGKAKVCMSAPNGKDLILAYYLSRGLIGDVELMTDIRYATASVITLSPFECIVVPFQSKEDPMFKNLTFMTALAKDLSKNLVKDSSNYTSNVIYTGEQRLCSYIFQGAYKSHFSDKLTDVAATIGVSYRHLLRLLNTLCEDGILRREHGGFKIVQEQKLRQRSAQGFYK
ncbi:MAG: cyclic nucleotide-binding domain-containing protein [Carnobacterium sp.]|uniref:Crp/Fnr family transcriptional regulator n=1 Tax=Carnobacterium sp. TaxID=48221 RepID=UPI002FCBAB07